MSSVAVVGAGPVGLTLALRLAQFGVAVTVLEQADRLRGEGSKALCMQRETLESWAALGFGQRVAERGVAWQLGRTYFRDVELFQTVLASTDEHFPPFVNVSQTEVEQLMVAAAEREPLITLAWDRAVSRVQTDPDGVRLTGAGLDLTAPYAVGTDGARSVVRRQAGIGFPGHSHADQFLIADIRAALPFPAERRFWFDPPWNPGRTVLIHPQPDNVWRIDWQVPPEFDLAAERSGGGLDARIRAVVGDPPYELVWVTVYRFHQRMAERFRVGRLLLAGDAAHLMSPFGARGLNSGVADAMNLAWRLAAALARPQRAEELLDGYAAERMHAARENLAVTEATMRFMVPGSPRERTARDLILRQSVRDPRRRAEVDSGRLAVPARYPVPSPTGGEEGILGAVLPDAPVRPLGELSARRLRELCGPGWLRLWLWTAPVQQGGSTWEAAVLAAPVTDVVVWPPDAPGVTAPAAGVIDVAGLVAERLGRAPRLVVVRPDGYVAAVRNITHSH